MKKYLITLFQILIATIIAIIILLGLIMYWIWAGSGFFILGTILIVAPIVFLLFAKYYKINLIKHNKKVVFSVIIIGLILTLVNIFQLKSIVASSIINCNNGLCTTNLLIPENSITSNINRYTFDLSYDQPLMLVNYSCLLNLGFSNGYIFQKTINFGDGTRHRVGAHRTGDIWIDGQEINTIPSGALHFEASPYMYNFRKLTLYKFRVPRPEFVNKFFEIIK